MSLLIPFSSFTSEVSDKDDCWLQKSCQHREQYVVEAQHQQLFPQNLTQSQAWLYNISNQQFLAACNPAIKQSQSLERRRYGEGSPLNPSHSLTYPSVMVLWGMEKEGVVCNSYLNLALLSFFSEVLKIKHKGN